MPDTYINFKGQIKNIWKPYLTSTDKNTIAQNILLIKQKQNVYYKNHPWDHHGISSSLSLSELNLLYTRQ